MKHKFLFLLILCLLSVETKTLAQTPKRMDYQIYVINPKTGKVIKNKDVILRIEVRKGSSTGSAAWSHDFNIKTSKSGMCDLALDFGDKVDWSNGEYYLVTLVNGMDMRSTKINSIPYAFAAEKAEKATMAEKASVATLADKAMALDEVLTKEDLIGTWTCSSDDESETLTFYDKGTGTYITQNKGDEPVQGKITWNLNKVGILAIEYINADNENKEDSEFKLWFTFKLSDNKIYMGPDGSDGNVFFKQK